ncbi:hypothetical protein C2869_01670 [Saccharobesus litoralis]|uniref:Uncharacterized protein n=1 Tax=Saccharobesus litoralis TaxID=2172099 RepID=A0A2S0VM84_9ALTE|nr:hypothetical protein C2869_01670 [Saccharobesus litoralis]
MIFDLKNQPTTWANGVNEDLIADYPEYIQKYGKVGSEKWWDNYFSGEIERKVHQGKVVFIGERADSCDEIWDIVEIDFNGELAEYDRCGYWKSDEIIVGALVSIESFEISLHQKYGPKTHMFDRLVQISKT